MEQIRLAGEFLTAASQKEGGQLAALDLPPASVLTSAALQEADCLSRRDSSGDLLLFFPEPNLDV